LLHVNGVAAFPYCAPAPKAMISNDIMAGLDI
jgi:hypothetical protein